ncbi:major royal jelly protein 1-like isoform X2 [Condylostylus longicornis]|uniref:major royal jelly protein 1-like isoform X2 n=1 Tax=Condylostylus longicornis TaxID=2530218 RepID=UPI00244DE9A6|nr:major royal jelly protein 1-like isoform X2 [Condylostylus longicornis]
MMLNKINLIILIQIIINYSNLVLAQYGGHKSVKTKLPNDNDIKIDLEYGWKQLEYKFPTDKERKKAIANGDYIIGTGTPIDVDVECHGYRKHPRRVFTTIPRFESGIPFTLAEVSNHGPRNSNGPILKPYPNYQWHKDTQNGENCDRITSVFRVSIDPCNRMWVIDSGRIGDIQYCPPQLLVFDLTTDTLFHRYKFPNNVYKSGQSLFITPIVDTRDPPPVGHCLNSKVYIADVTAYGLIVYDSMQDDSWRIEHETMRSSDQFSNITIAGESFMLQDGIFGMSVTPHDGGERFLIYHPLANNIEVMVPLSKLDNKSLWRNPNSNGNIFQVIGRRNEQASAQAIDSRGNLFFGLVNSIGIGSWNYKSPWNGNSSAVYINPETLQFASGLKIVKNQNNQEELWIMTIRFQKIMAGTLNTNEINFRIQKTLVNNLIC